VANNFLKSPVDQALAETQSQGMSLPQFASTDTRQPADVDPSSVPYQADFNASAKKYGVPVNVLMGLAEQESRFNPTALGQQTKYGRAKGVMQYIDSTAAGMGINPYNPQESIDAAAKQLKQRLDKGYSMEEAVSAHFAGDDRKQWGPKTAVYGKEVLARAERFLTGGKANVDTSRTPQEQAEAQVNADYPAAQSAMENVDQNRVKASAMLEALNTEEPDRYRPLTAQELQQLQIQKDATTVNPIADTSATPLTKITPDASTPEVAAQTPQAEPKGNKDGNLFTDTMYLLNSGLNMAARDVSEAVGMIPYVGKPIVNAMDRADRWLNNGKGTQQLLDESDKLNAAGFTPEMVQARKKDFVIEPGDDLGNGEKAKGWNFGPAWSDPRTYMSGIVESLPEMALTMGGAGVLAKGAYTGMIAKGATKAEAAKRAATVATVAGGFLEGSLGGAQASRQTRDEINKMTPDQLKDSDAMKALMDTGKTFEEARSTLADNSASKAFLLAGVGTGIFGGMGDRALVKVITGKSGRLKSALTGMIGEGLFEEAPQSAAQQMAQNYVKQDADPNQPLMKGVANQVAGGAVTGGIMGAGLGFAAPHVADTDTPAADQQQPEADTTQPVPVEQAVVVPSGPIGRAMTGSEATPAGAVNDWLGKAGDKTTINPKDDPETTMHVTVESYLPNGDVAVRDEDGTKYQLSPDDIDLTGEHRQSAEASRKDAEQAAKEAEKTAEKPAEQKAETITVKPAVRTEERQQPKTVGEMSEEELRTRLKYLGTQAKQNGWDARLTNERKKVEAAINAKTQPNGVDDGNTSASVPATAEADNASAVSADQASGEGVSSGDSTDTSGTDASVRNAVPATAAASDTKPALTDAQGNAKWFTTAERAQQFIEKKKAITTHEVVPVRGNRFEIRPIATAGATTEAVPVNTQAVAQSPVKIDGQTTETAGTSKKPRSAAGPHATRTRKILGADVGDMVTASEDVGYSTGGNGYVIDQIEKNGTVHLTNTTTSRKTTLSKADLERGVSRKARWTAEASQPVSPDGFEVGKTYYAPDDKKKANGMRIDHIRPDGSKVVTLLATGDSTVLPASQAPKPVKGEKLDKNWSAFTPESGTLNIPRADMPQIAAEHRGAMVNFLTARGITHTEETVPATSLKPTQREFSPAKVAQAAKFEGGDRSILASSDGHILDGHHQWLAKRDAGQDVKVIKLDAPISELLQKMQEFPSAGMTKTETNTAKSATKAPKVAPETAKPAPNAAETAPAADPAYGANNKLVSADRAAELRKKLKAKFSQLNSGIDPEILAIGTELAVFHIEAGVRKFSAFAKAMASDLDMPLARLRPYLRSWYNGARDMMEDSGISVTGMDNPDAVRSQLAALQDEPAQAPVSDQQSRASGSMDDMVNSFDSEVTNVSGTRSGVEPDSGNAGNPITGNENPVPDGSGRNDGGAQPAGRRAQPERSAGQRDQRLSDDGTATDGARSDKRIHQPDGQFNVEGGTAGSVERAGSRGNSQPRPNVDAIRAAAVARNADAPGASDLSSRLKAQKAARNVPTVLGNRASIDAALPLLLPEQRGDVEKIEARHLVGNGILVTNGTGTGKTATGMGVAKRFYNAGKKNILITVPTDKIASDWVKFAGMMDMPLLQLGGVDDNGGNSPVVTTYANFAMNDALAQREWDLIIPDESHYLSSNAAGEDTNALKKFRALTGHPDGFMTYMQSKHAAQYDELTQASFLVDELRATNDASRRVTEYPAAKANYDRLQAKWTEQNKAARAAWEQRWAAQADIPKVVFLSATPFAYVKSTDYAEGFLFHHTPPAERYSNQSKAQGSGYNTTDAREQFYVQHFGFRMRYNRLTTPDAAVNTELMEQNFNQWLKDTGALSGRTLDVPHDYDRRFALVDDAAGKRLDDALKYLNEGEGGLYRKVYDAVMKTFDFQKRMFLLESMKSRAAVGMIKEHLALGRKVVVFHDYNKGGGFSPFAEAMADISANQPEIRALAREVLSKPIFKIDFSGLESALTTLTTAYPDALLFNGTVPKKKRRENADLFNDDKSGKNLIIAQSDAAREGVSLHDTTGKHQRVEINLGMPTKPVAATQIEGRIYRTGQASDAIFRYLTTGTSWEAQAFASKIAERASTAENLALGTDARGLKQAFIDAYSSAEPMVAGPDDGKGGKAYDRSMSASTSISPFDKAKTYYFAQQKNTKRRGDREGVDYFATPEPVGFKMVDWAAIKDGEKVLEPSAGHGAIARFFPAQSDVTMVEPSYDLSNRAALANGQARIVNSKFEDLSISNKYDAIVMNPPYGSGGKTAVEHMEKAARHLREGGRMVALIPRGGQVEKRLEAFAEVAEKNGLHLVAKVAMPSSTFERAGTAVNTQVLVYERHSDGSDIQPQNIDLSNAQNVTELFDRIENIDIQPRQATTMDEALRNVSQDAPRFAQEPDPFVTDFMTELSAVDDLFQYPRVPGTYSLQGVFDQIAPEVKVVGETGRVDERDESGADERFMLTSGKGRDFYVYQTPDQVWIDVSRLEKGDGGSAIYAAVADYALNTKRKFIGDPAGLSDDALRRRTDAMLSSALKHSTTDHLEPHERQITGDPELGVPPLNWKEGDDLGNIRSLIDVSTASLAHYVPEISRARYDFDSGTFRTGEGKPLTDATLGEWSASKGRIRAAGAGRSTLKRSILLNSLVREPSGARSRLLERVLSKPSQLVTPALTGILYRPVLKPGVLNRVSTAMRDLVSRRDSLPMATYVNQENRLLKQLIGAPRTGAAEILADMRVQAEQGGINADTLAFGQWMLETYPQVANGLALDFVPGSDNAPLGRYYPAQRLVEIFKDYRNDNGRTVSSTEADTIVHEILHHTERMLPPRVQDAIAQEWMSAREAAMKDATADRAAMLDDLMLATTTGDPEAVSRTSIAVATGQITKADYALANPSEYWAVNAARILQGRQADSGSWVGIARRIMKSIIGRLRSMFGRSVPPLETALDSLLSGKGVEQSASQIRNLISYDLSPRPVMADSLDANMPRFKSGLTPNPEIPDTAQYDARTRSWWASTAQWTTDRMTTHMPKLLATVPMRPLVMELGRKLPQAAEYMRLKQSMDALRSKWHAKTDAVAQDWLKYRTGKKAENKVLMDIMHESTRAQVDPSEPFQAFMNANELDRLYNTTVGTDQHNELVRKDKLDKQRAQDYADLEERFKTLSPEGKEMYKKVRDTYTQMADAYEQVLMDNMEKAINVRIKKAERDFKKEVEGIRDAGLTGADRDEALEKAAKTLKVAKTKVAWNRKARLTQLRQQFEMNRLGGPYFPLARFGNLFVTVRDKASGKVESFSRFEDAGSQRKFAELMKAKPEFAVEVGALDDTEATRKAVDPNFVADVEDILADLPNADKIKDEVWQRYLETLPDFSVRKNRIHRKGREGFDADALRAFGSNMFHGSHQLARLAHAFDMTEAIDAAREEARKTNDPVRDTLVVNEIAKRNDFVMNPTGGPIAQGITQAAFIYALAASPKAAIANLFQTVIMGVPMLAAYHGGARGFVRATFELNKALADFTRGKGYAERAKSLSSDEKKAMASGYDIGIIDRTQSHDLAGIGETGTEYSPRRARFMAAIAWGFHNGERLNREVTYLAAYRMARAKGRGHEQAMIDAGNLTYKTHFDYQNTSRPRVMHTDLMKAALVFRNFQVNMLYRLFRDVHQTVNGESKEIRREALAQLAGTTGMMMLNAGLTGTWMFGVAMLLAAPFLDDGDDPEEELKKGMVNTLGPMMAGIVLDGVPGYITGTALSDSIGMPDLWFRSPNRQLEGKEEFQYWQSQLLGAAPSMLENVVRGFNMVTKGQTYKGIETMMPKAIKDPMKAYRYATEGLKNVKGDTIVDNVSAADVFKQAIGFTPARIAEQYETNNANYNKQQAIMGQRTQLLTDFKEAMKAGDEKQTDKVRAQIIAFNEKYPEQGLKAKNLQQSMKADARNRAKATNGMLYNRKLKGRILDEQSPPIYE